MNNNFNGQISVQHPYKIHMVFNNKFSGRINEPTYKMNSKIENNTIVAAIDTAFECGWFYPWTNKTTIFNEIVYVSSSKSTLYCFWSKLNTESWKFVESMSSDNLDSGTGVNTDCGQYPKLYPKLCTQYVVTKQNDLQNLFKNQILTFITTINLQKTINDFFKNHSFLFKNVNNEQEIRLSFDQIEEYLECITSKSWEPNIEHHINLLGNNFLFDKSYRTIAPQELSATLTVPGWYLWKMTIILGIISFLMFFFFITYFRNHLNLMCAFEMKECYFHFTFLFWRNHKVLKICLDFIIFVSLIVLYSVSSNYYEKGYFLDNLSLTNMTSNGVTQYFLLLWGLPLCHVFYYLFFRNFEYLYHHLALQNDKSPVKMFILIQKSTYRNLEHEKNESDNIFSNWKIFWISSYILCFLLSILCLGIYILFKFVPTNNLFAEILPPQIRDYYDNLYPALLTIFSQYILPFCLQKINLNSKWNVFFKILNTFLFTFILPGIFVFILSNECFNLWTSFWDSCYKNFNNFELNQKKYPYSPILTHEDICAVTYWQDVQWNRCSRSALRTITQLHFQKLVCLIFFIPFMDIISKLGKRTLKKYFPTLFVCCKSKTQEKNELTMVFKLMNHILLFGSVCPLMILMTYVAISINLITIFINKRLFDVHYICDENLIFGYEITSYICLFINNLFVIFFWYVNDFVVPFVLMIFQILYWIILLWKKCNSRRQPTVN